MYKIAALDRGYVRVVDRMPRGCRYDPGVHLSVMDSAVVEAARVSYGDSSKGLEQDTKLLHYLMDNGHGTPFEMAIFKFHVSCPIFVMRQWIRHRIGSFNEISARYTKMDMEFYRPEIWRRQGDDRDKQDSCGIVSDNPALDDVYNTAIDSCVSAYNLLLSEGVAKEMARMVLPVSLYTQFIWSVNARSLMNFLKLRMGAHAQWEIREYASAIGDVFSAEMPETANAFFKKK